jgi:V/A-type H+-transporting ATPase subunit F
LNDIVVIGDEDTVVGFRLAGVVDSLVHENPAETDRFIRDCLQRDVGVVVITDRVAAEVSELLGRLRSEKGRVKPIFVEIPDKRGPLEAEDRLQQLVRRVVGAEITLEAR